VYNHQNEFELALKYYNKSINIFKNIKWEEGIATSLNNIGLVYYNQGKIKQALSCYKESLEIHKKLGDKKGIALSFNNIASIYKENNNANQAIEYYANSLIIWEELEDKKGIAGCLNNIGTLTFEKGNLIKAKNQASKALKIAQDLGYPDQIKNAAELLKKIYQKEKSWEKAFEMQSLFITMRDSILNQETKKTALKQNLQYEYEKQKAIDNAEHDKQLAIEKEAKAKQKVITYATAGGLGLVIVFLIFVFNRLLVTRKQKNIIETQKLEVEQQKSVVEKAHFLLEEKNSEIIASIRYAKRIQDALMTSQKYIERNINRLKN